MKVKERSARNWPLPLQEPSSLKAQIPSWFPIPPSPHGRCRGPACPAFTLHTQQGHHPRPTATISYLAACLHHVRPWRYCSGQPTWASETTKCELLVHHTPTQRQLTDSLPRTQTGHQKTTKHTRPVLSWAGDQPPKRGGEHSGSASGGRGWARLAVTPTGKQGPKMKPWNRQSSDQQPKQPYGPPEASWTELLTRRHCTQPPHWSRKGQMPIPTALNYT